MNSAYAFVAGTVIFTVYGQLVVKWQTGKFGAFPDGTRARLRYLLDFFTSPWTLSAGLAAGIAAACWVVALGRLELSRAYPFISASFVLVLVLSAIIFGESLTVAKIAGGLLIIAGLIIGSR